MYIFIIMLFVFLLNIVCLIAIAIEMIAIYRTSGTMFRKGRLLYNEQLNCSIDQLDTIFEKCSKLYGIRLRKLTNDEYIFSPSFGIFTSSKADLLPIKGIITYYNESWHIQIRMPSTISFFLAAGSIFWITGSLHLLSSHGGFFIGMSSIIMGIGVCTILYITTRSHFHRSAKIVANTIQECLS